MNIKIVAAQLICNANALLSYLEMCDLIITKLKMHPTEGATIRKKLTVVEYLALQILSRRRETYLIRARVKCCLCSNPTSRGSGRSGSLIFGGRAHFPPNGGPGSGGMEVGPTYIWRSGSKWPRPPTSIRYQKKKKL